MRILIDYPNTSNTFTQRIESIAKQFAHLGTEIITRTASSGPRSIERIFDEVLSSQGTLDVALQELNNVDDVVIACYNNHPAIQLYVLIPVKSHSETGAWRAPEGENWLVKILYPKCATWSAQLPVFSGILLPN